MEPLQILIADDSPTIRRYIRRIMEINYPGCGIAEASNGWEALEQLEKTPVSLIFLDLIMPEMQGDEFLERAQTLIHSRRSGVIVLSSVNTLELRHKLAGEELVLFAQKPVLVDELREKVSLLLARTQASPVASPS
jgi:CheY-like chemotaxis protein